MSFNSNARSGTGIISHNEVNVYNFVAPRSGTYTFDDGKNGSRIATVAGLFNWSGKLIAGNDNFNGTTDSHFTAKLVSGTRYALAITNHTGTPNGGYKWSINGPPLVVNLYNSLGDGISSYGEASLTGNSLYIYLGATNRSNFYTHTRRVDVYLLGSDGKPIHSPSFSVTAHTAGKFVPGDPSATSKTKTFDLSGWDLRSLRNIRIEVS